MKQRSVVALCMALTLAAGIIVSALVSEAPSLPKASPRYASPADNEYIAARIMPLVDTVEIAGGVNEQLDVGNLVITLHDDSMFPLIDEQVQIRGPWHGADAVIKRTDHQGKIEFQSIVSGSYLYTIEAMGRPVLIASNPVYVRQGQTTELILQISSYDLAISGWMMDRRDNPLSGLRVTATATSLADSFLLHQRSEVTYTDSEGWFRLAGLRAGEYEITTEEDDHYLDTGVIVRAGVESIVLHVAENRMQQIEGLVTNTFGEHLAGVKVVPPYGSTEAVFTDLLGHFVLTFKEGIGEGRRYLRFMLDGYQETRFVLEGDTADSLVVDTTMTKRGETLTVSGRVTDEYGLSLAREHVQLHSPARYTTYRTITAEDGEFRLEGVAVSNDYRVWVRPKSKYADYTRESVTLTSGEPNLEIVLSSLGTGTVHGRIIDRQHNPVPNFHFWLRSAQAQGKAIPVTADENGSFAVEQIPAGMLTLGTRSQPYVRITDIELIAGSNRYIEVMLDQAF